MGNLFKPDVPEEDPSIAALRKQEQQRANDDKIKATQDQLATETKVRDKSFGLRSLLAGLGGGKTIRSLLGTG